MTSKILELQQISVLSVHIFGVLMNKYFEYVVHNTLGVA